MTLDAEGNMSGQVRDEHGGYASLSARQRLLEQGEKKYVSALATAHPSWEVPTYKFAALGNVNEPLRLDYELKQAATSPGKSLELYISPLAAFCDQQNPFQHEQRNYPVDFGALTQEVIMLTLTLPPGYTAELPKPAVIALPEDGGRYMFSATALTPGTVQLVSRLSLNKTVYLASEYSALREFYRLALAKQSEAMVIKKMQ